MSTRSPSLTPPPKEVTTPPSVEIVVQPKTNGVAGKASSSNGHSHHPNGDTAHPDTGTSSNEKAVPAKEKVKWEAPQADSPKNDWQGAYVWAFIVKFNQREKIRKLECVEDFERCLMEPVANRPDDILEGILIRFLANLKPGLRNLDCTNIQHHLSNYINDMLHSSPDFTVWDDPWEPNEEARGGCCSKAEDRTELGRLRPFGEPANVRTGKNPIRQIEELGGGLFELSWRERAKLLRQMVDWQLTHADSIKSVINAQWPNRNKKPKEDEEPKIFVEPMGLDRNKNRIWAFDHSGRLYKSGNPFKRPCPVYTISSTRPELQEAIDNFAAFGSQPQPKQKGASKAEQMANKKLLKGMEDEDKLAKNLTEMLPAVEKEEARIQRARRRIQQAFELASMAEMRATRTRRSTKKIDYTYGDSDDFDDEDDYPKKRRRDNDFDETTTARGKPFIPGERRSARVRAQHHDEDDYDEDQDEDENGDGGDEGEDVSVDESSDPIARSMNPESGSTSPSKPFKDSIPNSSEPSGSQSNSRSSSPRKKAEKGMKGYVMVPEYVPWAKLTEEEKAKVMQEKGGSAKVDGDGDVKMEDIGEGGGEGSGGVNGHSSTPLENIKKEEIGSRPSGAAVAATSSLTSFPVSLGEEEE